METAGIRAAISVLGKALSPLSGGMLEAWASSTKLGFNIEALKLELLEAEGMLNNTRGREIHNTALAELLDRLQQLAYGANDVLDELDYFRIQDELDGTYHAADSHASGYVQDLALNVRHTARACVNKLKFPVCSRAARGGDPDKQDDGTKQGCLSGLRPCGRRGDIGSSPQLPADHLGVQEARGGCMPKAANNVVGKLKFFRYLRNFIVAKENEGFELSQLGKLTEIGGSLSIYNLEKVQTKEDANELKLVTKIPPLPLDELQLLTSLKMIHIHCSSKVLPPVEGKGHGIYRFPVEDLTISHCDTSGEELTLLLSFLPNLSKLRIEECKNVTRLGVSEHAKTVSLEQKQQTSVEQKQQTREEEIVTVTATEGQLLFPPQIQELQILRCPKASLLSDPPQDTHTEVGGGGIQRLCSLRDLWVSNCPEFLSAYPSPSSSFLPFPTSLQYLNLEGVKHMETLQALSNLTSLTHLSLSGMRGSRAEGLWPLLAHGNLSKLHIFSGPTFFDGSDPSRPHDKEVFSCSSKLLDLKTGGSTGFLAAPTCSLFSSTLTRLDLSFDYKTEHLTKEQEEALQLLTSLQDLHFSWGPRLQHLPEGLHKLINLKKLLIFGCPALQSLPSLPSSLQKLVIRRCGAIKSLPNSLPTSLEILKIIGCKAIKSLPKNGLPSSLRELDVTRSNSEELKRECRKLIGTIPIVIT
ncbi:hypothetical protein ACQ4PT_041357 [Festuca glaucescens]